MTHPHKLPKSWILATEDTACRQPGVILMMALCQLGIQYHAKPFLRYYQNVLNKPQSGNSLDRCLLWPGHYKYGGNKIQH